MKEKPLVLVIDDEKDTCDLFHKVLAADYSVCCAHTGQEGLDRVKEKRPDIVLLDLKLPDFNGIEVLTQMKKIEKNVVVIIITAFGTMDTARTAMKLGAYDYVTKPFELDYVKAVIKDGLKMTLRGYADQKKEKNILKDIHSLEAKLNRLKHCHDMKFCLWEVALRSFVLGDSQLMARWMEDADVTQEEKLALLEIARILKADMSGKMNDVRNT